MDNELPTRIYFEVNEMGNKKFSWSGALATYNDFAVEGLLKKINGS